MTVIDNHIPVVRPSESKLVFVVESDTGDAFDYSDFATAISVLAAAIGNHMTNLAACNGSLAEWHPSEFDPVSWRLIYRHSIDSGPGAAS